MEQQHLRAEVKVKDKVILSASLEMVFFKEDDYMIAYCPALDLSAAGRTLKEAKEEFAQVFTEHTSDCLENGTLREDLIEHGWKVDDGTYTPPSMTRILARSKTLRNIVDTKEYQKRSVVMTRGHKMASV